MMTVQSRRGQKEADDHSNRSSYSDLLKQINMLSSSSWPAYYEDIPGYGEREVTELSERFQLDSEAAIQGFRLFKANGGREQPELLLDLVVSTAECERAFSTTNKIITKKRNRLLPSNVTPLMLINILGPPIAQFKPQSYMQAWLKRGGRSAGDVNSVKRNKSLADSYYSHVHTLLSK